MSSQTYAVTSQDRGYVTAKSNRNIYGWGVGALAAAVAYPYTPRLVFSTAHMAGSFLQLFLFSCASAVMLFFPACGLYLLVGSTGRADRLMLVRRGLGILLIVTPVMRVLSGAIASVLHMPARSLEVWYGLWVVLGALMLWRASNPEPLFSVGIMSKTKLAHGLSAILIAIFVVAHLTANLTILKSPEAYISSTSALRSIYRTPVGEPVLIGLLVLQVVTGLMMASEALVRRAPAEYLIQTASGLYFALYIMSHTTATAYLGRLQLNHGPDFTYASAGPAGLLAILGGVQLAPYYLLGVLAFFVHLSRPLRVRMVRMGKTRLARPSSYALVSLGGVVGVALLIALCTPMITRHAPHHFPPPVQRLR